MIFAAGVVLIGLHPEHQSQECHQMMWIAQSACILVT